MTVQPDSSRPYNKPSGQVFRRSLLALSIAAIANAASAGLAEDLTTATPITLQTFQDTAGAQYYGFDLTPLPDNQFALVWAEHYAAQAGEDPVADRILLQRYDGDGNKAGSEIEVAVLENGNFPWQPSVSADSKGNMLVAWGESAKGDDISGRVYEYCAGADLNSDVELKARLVARSDQLSDMIQPALAANTQPCAIDTAMDEDGDFALLWALKEENNKFGARTSLQVETFNQLGQSQISAPVKVKDNTYLTGDLAFYANNALIVAFVVVADDGESSLVMGQRYDLQGGLVGQAFRLDNGTSASNERLDSEVRPTLAVNANLNEGFIASWIDDGYPGDDRTTANLAPQIRTQRWLASASPTMDGVTVLADVLLNSGHVSTPSLGMDSDGNFLSVWSMGNIDEGDVFLPKVLAAAFSGENEPLTDATLLKQYSYSHVPSDEFQSARIAMNDQAMMLAWLDGDISEGASKTLDAIFVPGLVAETDTDTDTPTINSTGGTLSWLLGLIVAVLGWHRGWRLRSRR